MVTPVNLGDYTFMRKLVVEKRSVKYIRTNERGRLQMCYLHTFPLNIRKVGR